MRCQKLRDGGLEVEFRDETQAGRALAAKHFTYTVRDGSDRREVQIPMKVTPHRTKNSCKGVIFCPDLVGVSDGEIEEGLSESGVTCARRILRKRDKKMIPTHSVILTFDGIDLPQEVLVGYLAVKVRPYVPSPMRCYRCLRFGHTRINCPNQQTCGKCADTDHSSDDCTAETVRCVNCDATQTPHNAMDPTCPAYLREKEIVSIMATERISFREAKERYDATHPKKSYARVVSEQRRSFTDAAGETQPNQLARRDDTGSMRQLIALLQSFGLRFVASPGVQGVNVSTEPQETVRLTADADTQTSLADVTHSVASESRVSEVPAAPAEPAARETDPTEGQKLAQNRKDSGSSQAADEQSVARNVTPPAVAQEAIRRGEEERRLREARRARVAEKAKEARSQGAGKVLAPGVAQDATKPTRAKPPPMGPPPPPPPPPPPLPPRQSPNRSVTSMTTETVQTRPPLATPPLGAETGGSTSCPRPAQKAHLGDISVGRRHSPIAPEAPTRCNGPI